MRGKAKKTASGTGRSGPIERGEIVAAALRLMGPQRGISTLSLREVAREAGIAPNSFYRHFRDMDELAIALIDLAGGTLRKIIREARLRLTPQRSAVRTSIEVFMEQLEADQQLLHILLREASVGSDAFKRAVDRELRFFEDELCDDLVRLFAADGAPIHAPALVAKAITRLVFTVGAEALDQPPERRRALADQMIAMVRMIVAGTEALARAERAG